RSCRCCSCSSRSPCWWPCSPATWPSHGSTRALGKRGEVEMTGLLVQAPTADVAVPAAASRRGGRFWTALRRSPKAMGGLGLFVVFCIVAAIPQLFADQKDTVALTNPPFVHPSAAHWLGTTHLGQDIYAQLIWGTRQSLLIALIAGG